MIRSFLYQLCLGICLFSSCRKPVADKRAQEGAGQMTAAGAQAVAASKPNIIMILGDDIGYEIPAYTGGQSYQTPNIDKLAANGIQFTHCYATPNCCPSRTELISGKYNFRNYTDWGTFDLSQKTFVNYLKGAGYATCVAGKWQFGNGDAGIKSMGFDKYLVWDALSGKDDDAGTGRYKNPELYRNGAYLPATETAGKYGEDMFADYISSFIDSNKGKPFCIYYAPNLCHPPFCPTPDDADYAAWDPSANRSDKKYFPSMVKYMDKKIGALVAKISALGLSKNTVFVFSGDNGTPSTITSLYQGRKITGGKSTTTEFGVHVPLVVSCPSRIISGSVQAAVTDFTDLFTTFTDIARIPASQLSSAGVLDGVSLYPYFTGSAPAVPRTWAYCYWKPLADNFVQNKHFVQDTNYKLYDSTNANKFYNVGLDSLEKTPLKNAQLTPQERSIRQSFQDVLSSMHN